MRPLEMLPTRATIRGVVAPVGKKRCEHQGEPIIRKKRDLKMRQRTPTTAIAAGTSEAIEQQVREHPVVQEVMRTFDAHIVAITRVGVHEGAGRPAVEQQVLWFTSPV
jgi:hypothetical protein